MENEPKIAGFKSDTSDFFLLLLLFPFLSFPTFCVRNETKEIAKKGKEMFLSVSLCYGDVFSASVLSFFHFFFNEYIFIRDQ